MDVVMINANENWKLKIFLCPFLIAHLIFNGSKYPVCAQGNYLYIESRVRIKSYLKKKKGTLPPFNEGLPRKQRLICTDIHSQS